MFLFPVERRELDQSIARRLSAEAEREITKRLMAFEQMKLVMSAVERSSDITCI